MSRLRRLTMSFKPRVASDTIKPRCSQARDGAERTIRLPRKKHMALKGWNAGSGQKRCAAPSDSFSLARLPLPSPALRWRILTEVCAGPDAGLPALRLPAKFRWWTLRAAPVGIVIKMLLDELSNRFFINSAGGNASREAKG